MDIDLIKVQEIYSTLTQCQGLLSRSELQVTELEKRIRELEQDGIRFESAISQISEAKKDSIQRFEKYQLSNSQLQTLIEWKTVSNDRMDKIATSLWSAVVTGIVGFIGMTIVFYLSGAAKPAKTSHAPTNDAVLLTLDLTGLEKC